MQLTLHLPTFRADRGARHRRPQRSQHRAVRAAAPARVDRTPPTQDRAFYTCSCGYAFTAAVSTSVGCPNCGAHQAW